MNIMRWILPHRVHISFKGGATWHEMDRLPLTELRAAIEEWSRVQLKRDSPAAPDISGPEKRELRAARAIADDIQSHVYHEIERTGFARAQIAPLIQFSLRDMTWEGYVEVRFNRESSQAHRKTREDYVGSVIKNAVNDRVCSIIEETSEISYDSLKCVTEISSPEFMARHSGVHDFSTDTTSSEAITGCDGYQDKDHNLSDNKSRIEFSIISILIFVTVINAALFFGGQIYTGFRVQSIQERFDKATEKLAEAENKYKKADDAYEAQLDTLEMETSSYYKNLEKFEKDLDDTMDDFDKSIDEFGKTKEDFDKMKGEINNKRKELENIDIESELMDKFKIFDPVIASGIKVRLHNIDSALNSDLADKIDSRKDELKTINEDITDLQNRTDKLQTLARTTEGFFNNIRSSRSTLSLKDVWFWSALDVRVSLYLLIAVLILVSIVSLILSIQAVRAVKSR